MAPRHQISEQAKRHHARSVPSHEGARLRVEGHQPLPCQVTDQQQFSFEHFCLQSFILTSLSLTSDSGSIMVVSSFYILFHLTLSS